MPEEQVSIFDDSLNEESEFVQYDIEADAFESIPIPEGPYLCKLSQVLMNGQNGQLLTADMSYYKKKLRDGTTYFAVGIRATTLTPDEPKTDDRSVTDGFVSTMVMRNRKTCRVAGVLDAVREELNPRAKHNELLGQLITSLEREPTCIVDVHWEAQGKTGKDQKDRDGNVITDSDGNPKPEYINVLNGMRSFPMRTDGSYAHEVFWDRASGRTSLQPPAALTEDQESRGMKQDVQTIRARNVVFRYSRQEMEGDEED